MVSWPNQSSISTERKTTIRAAGEAGRANRSGKLWLGGTHNSGPRSCSKMILDYHKSLGNCLLMPYTTRQKLALANVISDAERPLTPAEICKEAQKGIPKLGIATVYRVLKQFLDEGQVRLVEMPGIPPHYESAARQHHHFFFCNHCQRLFSLAGCVRGVLGLAPRGFAVKRHEIVLYGDCTGCRGHA